MTTKRKRISSSVFKGVAVPQRDPVEAAIRPSGREPVAPKSKARAGRVGIQFWVEPPLRRSLKRYAAETDRTLEDLLNEAVRDLMLKHKIR